MIYNAMGFLSRVSPNNTFLIFYAARQLKWEGPPRSNETWEDPQPVQTMIFVTVDSSVSFADPGHTFRLPKEANTFELTTTALQLAIDHAFTITNVRDELSSTTNLISLDKVHFSKSVV